VELHSRAGFAETVTKRNFRPKKTYDGFELTPGGLEPETRIAKSSAFSVAADTAARPRREPKKTQLRTVTKRVAPPEEMPTTMLFAWKVGRKP